MNVAAILSVLLAWGASLGGMYWYAEGVGQDRVTARVARDDEVAKQTREAAQQGAARAIAELKPVNKTIVQRAEKEIYENTVYRDCRVPAAGVQLANEAITGVRPDAAGDRELPGPGAAQ